MAMLDIRSSLIWLLGILALGLLVFLTRTRFGAEARERRRREKSHRPVVSRKPGPTVKLAVKVNDRDRDRKK